MKWLYVFVAIFLTVNAQVDYCTIDVKASCDSHEEVLPLIGNCNANYSGFSSFVEHVQDYANEQLHKSYDYLLLAANFGTYKKNRPGFEKQFRALSDSAWERSIDIIKHITKRGGKHDFARHRSITDSKKENRTSELNEIQAMAFALDTEKSLALKAHHIHEYYSHANKVSKYDAEMSHYLEEKFIEDQATTIRKFSGYTNDLKRLLDDSKDASLSLFMFDEYLQKQ